jgi:hypothetical protein
MHEILGHDHGFLSHIRIQATLTLSQTFAGGFGIQVTAIVTLAIDLDAANNGFGGPDHAVLFDMWACPVLTGPPVPDLGKTPSFELGGIDVNASVHWKVVLLQPGGRLVAACMPQPTHSPGVSPLRPEMASGSWNARADTIVRLPLPGVDKQRLLSSGWSVSRFQHHKVPGHNQGAGHRPVTPCEVNHQRRLLVGVHGVCHGGCLVLKSCPPYEQLYPLCVRSSYLIIIGGLTAAAVLRAGARR